jgi:hypothetical protein
MGMSQSFCIQLCEVTGSFVFVINIGGIVDHHRLKLSFHKRIELWYYTRNVTVVLFNAFSYSKLRHAGFLKR